MTFLSHAEKRGGVSFPSQASAAAVRTARIGGGLIGVGAESGRERMHSSWYRLNTLFTFAVLLLAVLCGAASFLDAVISPLSSSSSYVRAHAQVLKVNRFRKQLNGNDEVSLNLNVSMDMRPLFTWNTKQVFVFLAAEYETPKNSVNQISLWDHIIPDKDKATFSTKVNSKYPLIDQGSNLRSRKVDLVLHWHVMPKTGRTIQDKLSLSNFHLPEAYT